MSQYLRTIKALLLQNHQLSKADKGKLLEAVAEAEKQLNLTESKLDQSEKAERTTSILLEETIEELELKRKVVEEKNRELEIETSLERVRSIALSMKEPADMLDVCRVISQQSESLGIKEIRNVQTVIINEQKGTYVNYQYFAAYDQSIVEEVDYHKHPTVKEMAEKMISSPDAFFTGNFEGKELEKFRSYRKLDHQLPDPILDRASTLDYYFYSIGPGGLGLSTYKPLSEGELDVFKQFHKVFSLAYRRFLDIEKAEAQAREVMIEAALERVRSRAMAMQTSEELNALIGKVFTECTKLDMILDRCILMIYDPKSYDARWWMANSEAPEQPVSFLVKYHEHIPNMAYFNAWKQRIVKWQYTLEGATKKNWDEFLFSETELSLLPDAVKAGMQGVERVYINASFNNFGSLTLSTLEPLPDEHFDILLRFAKVFDLTYTRFNDLKLAEAQAEQAVQDLIKLQSEKKRAEDALTELRSTQTQLIQSEKMASLGELTAGIAHEIQNPLNFVNNFSEVNTELIEEMKQEIEKGNLDEVKAIANDIADNERKITQHGKRADAIVKGMLQHSRSSSGVKEPTNINAIADEYLRLAYHGLRAKDKSFNATMITNFDQNIRKINVIPQDIGRVILNLITNAFYSVAEKKQLNIPGYEPTVSVSTMKENGNVVIKVKDNGNGIPPKVLDKIYQPFFTTKPTGQGTGLGLSMSYEIVTNAHGGELKVDTKEGEGAEFTIILPV